MGSQVDDTRELVVLVTGFEPFRSQWPVNPSWEIAKSLPSHLPAPSASSASSSASPDKQEQNESADDNDNDGDDFTNGRIGRSTTTAKTEVNSVVLPPVRILVHPEPLRVCYKYVHAVVPSFYDGYDNGREVDIVLHMGMSGPRPFYQLERRAHGRGYKIPDVDGQTPDYDDDDDDEGGGGEDGSFPDTLDSGLDIEDVHRRWTALCSKDMDLRISDNAGRFLCDWIYWCSLAHLVKAHRPRKVCFFHVPASSSESALAQGRELALNLIRAIAESETEASAKRAGKRDGGHAEAEAGLRVVH